MTIFEKAVLCELARASSWPVKDLHLDIQPHIIERTRRSESCPSERSCRRAIEAIGLTGYLPRREAIEVGTLAVHLVQVTWEEKKYLTNDYVLKKGNILVLMERHTGFLHLVRINAPSPDFVLSQLKRIRKQLQQDFRLLAKKVCFVTYRKEGGIYSTALDMDMVSLQKLLGEAGWVVGLDAPTHGRGTVYLGRFATKGDLGKLIRKAAHTYNFGISRIETKAGSFDSSSKVSARLHSHLKDSLSRLRRSSFFQDAITPPK
ncbi:hypothetical protein KP003_02955 [Geomonas nitrogeniifigens]|uniref:hypothetical protein n=1 Tax=Geomonas diazotrophica TaxID=2843197 RepID=UPI001C2C1CC3|nr:hypothetical protein [Geomonas nitrogeniifigens]QXE87384.1 hypothetical protein KP003_02955 [Geomonas nitrogeniifigens]